MQKYCKPSNYKSFVHFVNTSKILQVRIRIPELEKVVKKC